MARDKGKQNAKAVEKDFPHLLDMVVPPGASAMYEFHTRHGIKPQRGHGRHDDNGSVIRWCFADPAVALEFANQFGGVIQLPPSIL